MSDERDPEGKDVSDREGHRFLVRAAAKHAARLVTLHFDDGEDEAALADRFETAGLDNLARGGIDVRTDLSGFEAK